MAVASLAMCPPPLAGGACLGSDMPMQDRRNLYGEFLEDGNRRIQWLWAVATRRWEFGDIETLDSRNWAFMRLLETMQQLTCLSVFTGCFPGGLPKEHELGLRLCALFREELGEAFRRDYGLGVLTNLFADSPEGAAAVLARPGVAFMEHPCYGRITQPFGNAFIVNPSNRIHDGIAQQAYGPSRFVPDSTNVFAPSWTAPPAHSFGVCGQKEIPAWWKTPNVSSLLNTVAPNQKGWVVNLGASDGACPVGPLMHLLVDTLRSDDPANCLLQAGHGGVIFEGNSYHFNTLRTRFLHRMDVSLHLGHANPQIAGEAITAYAQKHPHEPLHLLKVDLDNCDCCFLEELLQIPGVHPLFIHVEVHALVPPPILFRPKSFDEKLQDPLSELGAEHERRGHMLPYCSLSSYVELLRPFGYELVHLIYHDAVFVQLGAARKLQDQWPSAVAGPRSRVELEALWFGGWYCHPLHSSNVIDRQYREEFLYDYRRWNDPNVPAEIRVSLIREYLEAWNVSPVKYVLRLERNLSEVTS